ACQEKSGVSGKIRRVRKNQACQEKSGVSGKIRRVRKNQACQGKAAALLLLSVTVERLHGILERHAVPASHLRFVIVANVVVFVVNDKYLGRYDDYHLHQR
ncbi:MAG: hypothetical protein P8L85_19875, partial [Rubripirellula sp.]|nr:hypothetical protein [Rubripirellula sp.]